MKAATKPLVTLGDSEKKQVAVSYTLPDSLNKNSAGKTAYKIINKAYFHNAPDERTKRNAFVVHWNNSYTTINPLYEKNGFVYVVFHNHLNQTSKGWLRKKDLKPIEQ
jgi:serine/threonine-protein kinase